MTLVGDPSDDPGQRVATVGPHLPQGLLGGVGGLRRGQPVLTGPLTRENTLEVDEGGGIRGHWRRFRARVRCPPCTCLTRLLAVMQACADGQGAWPSGRWVSSLVCPAVLLLQAWALAYCFLGADVHPDGPLFRLVAMFICARLAGWLVRRMTDVPALVGMLAVGVAMKNAAFLDVPPDYAPLIGMMRQIALVLIMVRAGLGLDPGMLRSLSAIVLGLAVVPAAVEVGAVTLLAYPLLDLPWLWGLLLGLVLAAVAPSVVMPCFMELRDQGLGVDKGIDTLVVAAASFDDVIAISLYGLVQSLIFQGGSVALDLVQHPLGLVFGILYGVVLGKALQFVPTGDASHVSAWRFALVLGGGLVVTFGSAELGFHEAGSVGCISTAFVAAAGWRRMESPAAVYAVDKYFELLWFAFEPIMFSLIGADIDTDVLDGNLVGLAVGCILGSLVLRMLSTWLLLFACRSFNWKERLFVALAWLPKADVQAALGPLALDVVRGGAAHAAPADEVRARTVLLVAVLCILLTAPAGAIIIAALGRRLLTPTRTTAPPPTHGADDLQGGTIATCEA